MTEMEQELALASEGSDSWLREPQDDPRHRTSARVLGEWESRGEELMGEVEVVELLQEDESPGQMQDLVLVKGTDGAESEATGSLPAGQLVINEHSLQYEYHYI
jgi:hypothetical protein